MPKNQALVEQLTVRTKICVILYSNPSVLDDEGGCRRPPPPHIRLLTSGSRVFNPVGEFVWTSSGSVPIPDL